MRKRLQKLLEEIAQILDSKEFAEMFPEGANPDEKRVEELRDVVSRHESEGTPATLGTLRKRNGFEPVEVERLAKRFPGKMAIKDSRNPKGGPTAKVVSFVKNETH